MTYRLLLSNLSDLYLYKYIKESDLGLFDVQNEWYHKARPFIAYATSVVYDDVQMID